MPDYRRKYATLTMKRNLSIKLAILLTFTVLTLPLPGLSQGNQSLKKLKGYWIGSLKVQMTQLRLVMNVNAGERDTLIVTFDSPDQGILDLPTDRAAMYGDSLDVSAQGIGGYLCGRINKALDTLHGTWKQGGMSFPILMVRQGKKATLNRPQEPKPPFPYDTEEITFRNPAGGFDLSGTLTLPNRTGRFPAVILVTGSGPQNRDEELLGHKPFLVLADYLTRLGYAVFRYDDRGIGKSKGVFGTATTPDFATDAEAALDMLRKRPGIDTTKLGIAGHSEGALVATIVASRRPEIKFVILLAGPGTTGEEILLRQSELINRAEGTSDAAIALTNKLNRDCYLALKKNQDNDQAGRKIRSLMKAYDKARASDTSYHSMTEDMLNAQVATLTSPWFRTFLSFDPQPYLSQIKCPLLALGGSLDLQVPAKENLDAIERAMIFGGNSSYTVKELPGLNHLFQTAKTGSPVEYATIEETFSPEAMGDIYKWLQEITK